MNSHARLLDAKSWINTYTGKNLVRVYAKWYAVDRLCALKELKLVGISFSADAELQIIRSFHQRNADKRSKKDPCELQIAACEFNEDFAFIAGYTSNGVPYGLRHDESSNLNYIE